ncbi:MAG: AMP-binding protein, partial [Acidobacteria bacterium]|nr:AMP-binding protein [Acidobacteriota bacterium]
MPVKSALSWGDKDLRKVKSPEELPEIFNFAAALLDRHLAEGRGSRVALLGPAGTLTYAELVRLANQAGNALQALGVERENRVLLLLRDSPEFIATYLGAMKIGAIPTALNTFAHPSEYEFYVRHSRAKVVVGEAEFLEPIEPMLKSYPLRGVISVRGDAFRGTHEFQKTLSGQSTELDPAPTVRDDMSHWVYTSGSTGEPKAAVHLHKNM